MGNNHLGAEKQRSLIRKFEAVKIPAMQRPMAVCHYWLRVTVDFINGLGYTGLKYNDHSNINSMASRQFPSGQTNNNM